MFDFQLSSRNKQRVKNTFRQNSNISRALVGNNIVGHSDVVGASPVNAAPTTSSFSARRGKKHLSFEICCVLH